MKDQIIKLNDGLEFCVLDEMSYENKKYIIAFQVNSEKEEIMNTFIISEVKTDLNGKITIDDIDDKKLFDKVSTEFLKRMQK